PVMRAVRPVVSEERNIAVLIFANDQAIAWPPVILDRETASISVPVTASKSNLQFVPGMSEFDRLCFFSYLVRGQPSEIECDLSNTTFLKFKKNLGFSSYFVAVLGQSQLQFVINDVKRGRARIGIAGGSCCTNQAQQREQQKSMMLSQELMFLEIHC